LKNARKASKTSGSRRGAGSGADVAALKISEGFLKKRNLRTAEEEGGATMVQEGKRRSVETGRRMSREDKSMSDLFVSECCQILDSSSGEETRGIRRNATKSPLTSRTMDEVNLTQLKVKRPVVTFGGSRRKKIKLSRNEKVKPSP
jgi:hypothetical protein